MPIAAFSRFVTTGNRWLVLVVGVVIGALAGGIIVALN